jgi:hypothetical protein
MFEMSIGFKEWALVCDQLGAGAQSLILRKGGIAEGRAGFEFKHPEFFLFPTFFHEQVEKLKLPQDVTLPDHDPATVRIDYFARIEWTALITDWDAARSLDEFHVWRAEVISERFAYGDAGALNMAFVRVFKLQETWKFPDRPAYGGCRSWVNLPDTGNPPAMSPVLDAQSHHERSELLRRIVHCAEAI